MPDDFYCQFLLNGEVIGQFILPGPPTSQTMKNVEWESILPVLNPTTKLAVPYRSQEDPDADHFRNDCGPACVAMLYGFYYQKTLSIDDLSRETTLKTSDTGLSVSAVSSLLAAHQITPRVTIVSDPAQLQAEIEAGHPPILLIHYGAIPGRENVADTSGHFVVPTSINVVTGKATVNDPDWWGADRIHGQDFEVSVANLMIAIAHSPDPGKAIFTSPAGVPPPPVVTSQIDDRVVNASLLNVRVQPAVKSQKLGVGLTRGQHVQIEGSISDSIWTWAELITVDGVPRDGYVAREFLIPPPAQTLYTLTALRIRSSPNGTPIGTVGAGVAVLFSGEQQAAGDYLWGRTVQGWIAIKSLDGISVFCAEREPAPTPVIATGYHYGLHLDIGCDGNALRQFAKDVYAAGHKPTYLIVNDVGLANDLTPYGFTIMRRQDGNGDVNPSVPNGASEQDAEQIGVDFVKSRWSYIYELAHTSCLVFQNEPGYHPLDYAVNIGIMKECERRGKKAAILAYAVGNPNGSDWAAKYTSLIPAMRYAAAHGHYALLHEYGAENPPTAPPADPASQEWYSLRHRKFYDLMPSDARPFLVIGETGNFAAQFMGTNATVADMKAYNALLEPYVIGYCWWTAGGQTSGWGKSTIDSALPQIKELFIKG